MTQCPVCMTEISEVGPSGDGDLDGPYSGCPRCGRFGLTPDALSILPQQLMDEPDKRAILSHRIRAMQADNDSPTLSWEVAKRIIDTGKLPSPQEQADNLVRWLGDNVTGPGERADINPFKHAAIIGAKSPEGFKFVVLELGNNGIIEGAHSLSGASNVTLTFQGWRRYDELRTGATSGRRAFMAMEYGVPDLDNIVEDYVRPAVAETGFNLRRLDDEQPAGLIDDRLRVEIQSSRFLIADLTHANRGAYWEAGYAEGLGKPVIYTCEKSVFEKASHFDTNHHLHIVWESDKLEDAMTSLKATIRATIPEAKRENS